MCQDLPERQQDSKDTIITSRPSSKVVRIIKQQDINSSRYIQYDEIKAIGSIFGRQPNNKDIRLGRTKKQIK